MVFVYDKLGVAAEHGYFLRENKDAEWETCVAVLHFYWKQIAGACDEAVSETTDGSTIETKESGLVWNYQYADPHFGSCQAKKLLDHLESVLANELITVKSGQNIVKVKPQIVITSSISLVKGAVNYNCEKVGRSGQRK